ncbi:SAPS-domain-containing protein [Aureobasidium subglaciale]|nr:SAPS-domain-containing protein [Aureobasidium subglaciale]KAI5229046.1 SAPS-domain-containing protein [Aureobasidium subglaciale]KAI5232788.1 SAPS-domain-containing protein [Aureobasidium subglaciale]KAI5266100.1 SAPS-domain-containing protein [Aureobasidium subglaciale]
MFWRFGGYANISSIDSILEKPNVSLEELLDESDLIQELKQNNSKLIEFLREESTLQKLLEYVVADKPPRPDNASTVAKDEDADRSSPISFFKKSASRSRSKSVNKSDAGGEAPEADEEDKGEALRKKYAYVACEVLSSDVWSITEAVLEYQNYLRDFWNYVSRPAPLDPLQAGYFTKVNESLLDKKTDEMMAFFKSLDHVVPDMLQHVDCPMIMDLLLKIISLEKAPGGQGIVDWLQTQELIPVLLSYLGPDNSPSTQTAAGDFLKAIITISANATTQDQTVIGPNELTRQLVSDECTSILIKNMLAGGNSLTVGVGIIIEVIRKNNSDYDLDNQVGPEPRTTDPIYLGSLLRQFATHVPDFMHLIRSAGAKKPGLKTAFGKEIQPLGFDRFKTCELMAELLHCSNMALLNERGSDAQIKHRDDEREKLKLEGRLTGQPIEGSSYDEHEPFASSVDSHGFHHAQRPDDDLSGSPEEIKRLEVQNASEEDGFEKVAVSEADEFNEIAGDTSLPPSTKQDDPSSIHHSPSETSRDGTTVLTEEISQLHIDSPEQEGDESQPEGKRRVSLLTQQLQQHIQESELNFSSDQPRTAQEDVDMLSHPEDKPAPLFTSPSKTSHSASSSTEEDPSHSTATLQPEAHPTEGENGLWEADVDGSPVVGDLLKIKFVEHQVVPTILDFFFRFPWNNFLHNVVYDVVQQVFNGSFERGYNRTLAIDLFCQSNCTDLASQADVTQRILDGQTASDNAQKEKGMRLGYMGHLTLIAEEVLKLQDRQAPEVLGEQIMERITRDEWIQYLESTLSETRDRDNAVLGGVKPDQGFGARQVGMGANSMLGQGNFSGGNNSSALSNAGLVPADSMALQEAADASGYDTGSAGLLSGFGNGDDDDDDLEESITGEKREKAVDDDEQQSITSPDSINPSPQPLNLPPSRARNKLAQRLAARAAAAEETSASPTSDPDALDATAIQAAFDLSVEPLSDLPDLDLSAVTERQINELIGVNSEGRVVSAYSTSSSDPSSASSSSDEENSFGRDEASVAESAQNDSVMPGVKRRPSTTEAKKRIPLDDEEEEATTSSSARSRIGLQRQISDPFQSPENSSGEEGSSSSSSEEEELMFGRKERVLGVE